VNVRFGGIIDYQCFNFLLIMFCPLSAVCLAEKQQTPILQSFI